MLIVFSLWISIHCQCFTLCIPGVFNVILNKMQIHHLGPQSLQLLCVQKARGKIAYWEIPKSIFRPLRRGAFFSFVHVSGSCQDVRQFSISDIQHLRHSAAQHLSDSTLHASLDLLYILYYLELNRAVHFACPTPVTKHFQPRTCPFCKHVSPTTKWVPTRGR